MLEQNYLFKVSLYHPGTCFTFRLTKMQNIYDMKLHFQAEAHPASEVPLRQKDVSTNKFLLHISCSNASSQGTNTPAMLYILLREM